MYNTLLMIRPYLIGILIFGVFAGCTSTKPNSAFPAVETKIWSSNEKRPDWSVNEPQTKNDNYLFVGLSDKKALERDARDEAYRHAINNVVRYISVDVKDKFEKIVTSAGLSTDIIDPTKVIRNFEIQLSSAIARKVKPSEWYIEQWKRTQGSHAETYYMVYVLASAPQSEVNETIAQQQKYQAELITTAKNSYEQFGKSKAMILEADTQIECNPTLALTFYKEIAITAEKTKASLQAFPELAGIILKADEIINSAQTKSKNLLKNPEAMFVAGIMCLVKNPGEPVTAALAKVTYQETEFSSEFGNYLAAKIEGTMAKDNTLFKVTSQKVLQEEIKKGKIPISDCILGKFDAEKQPILKELKALLFARYWEKKDSIEIKLELLEIGKGTLIGSSSIELPKNILPERIALKPANDQIAEEGLSVFANNPDNNSELKVKVWPDKGESSVYLKDELMGFHFKANKDCYVYLYHMDAEGKVSLLFPNSFNKYNFIKANQVYTIPDNTMNFDFKITPPFGAEMVKAIASLQPIKSIETGENGFLNIGNIADSGVKRIIERSVTAVPREARSEDMCTLTSIKE